MTALASNLSAPGSETHQDWNEAAQKWGQIVGFEKEVVIKPSLVAELKYLTATGRLVKTMGAVDYGCGHFTLGITMLREGIPTDGIDTSKAMVENAKQNLDRAKDHLPVIPGFMPTIALQHTDLPEKQYSLGLMCFVHQCAKNLQDLTTLFKSVGIHLSPGSSLVLIGAHPDKANLSEPHASVAYNYPADRDLEDGDFYTGTIFDIDGKNVVELVDERYWRLPTLQQALQSAGFYPEIVQDIADQSSKGRKASNTAPFFMLTAIKTELDEVTPSANLKDTNIIKGLMREGRIRQ